MHVKYKSTHLENASAPLEYIGNLCTIVRLKLLMPGPFAVQMEALKNMYSVGPSSATPRDEARGQRGSK
jgi:hypothetical protein